MVRVRPGGGAPTAEVRPAAAAGGPAEPEPSPPPAEIPDCVLSELWSEHSDGVGSPLIDIFTDCSSQMSDEEAAPPAVAVELAEAGAGRADGAIPALAADNVIEVVDDEFGATSGGGGIIWVVENDIDAAPDSEPRASPGGGPGAPSVGDAGDSPNVSSLSASPVWVHQKKVAPAPRRRKPTVKVKGEPRTAKWPARPRQGKSSRPAASPLPEVAVHGGSGVAGVGLAHRMPPMLLDSDATLSDFNRIVSEACADTAVSCSAVRSVSDPLAVDPVPSASVSSESDPVAPGAEVSVAESPEHFHGFASRAWRASRARWLLQLSSIAAEERRTQPVGAADSALLRLRELATAAAAGRPDGVRGETASPAGPAADVDTGAASCALPTYVTLLPDSERDHLKGGFLSMLTLRHVNDPPAPRRLSRTMRQRLRKRKAAPDEASEKENPSESPGKPRVPTLLAALPDERRSGGLPPARRMKVLRKPGAHLLRRGFVAQSDGEPPPAAESSGDEAAAASAAARRASRRRRRRLLDFGEMVEVDGVLDLADTYSGSAEPPPLQLEPPPAGDRSPPPRPPELQPQRWLRAGAARCRVCRKFIARVLMPLHLRLHRTGYHGCDVCGQVIESAAALYRHRLGHEPPCYTCTRCSRSFDAPAKLERHRASAHGLLLCARCGALVPTPELVHSHDCGGGGGDGAPQPPAPAPALAPPATAVASPASAGEEVSRGRPAGSPVGDGLSCDVCGKSFLMKFNYSMHMQMVHKRARPPSELAAPLCPDSVLSCLGDILSPDLYSEIVSVV